MFCEDDRSKLNNHIAFLFAINEVSRLSTEMYVSYKKWPYFEYDFDIYELIASFKNLYFKHDSKRLL